MFTLILKTVIITSIMTIIAIIMIKIATRQKQNKITIIIITIKKLQKMKKKIVQMIHNTFHKILKAGKQKKIL